MGKFGLFALGMLLVILGLVGFAFASQQGQQGQVVNPLCSMVQALSANWGIITVLIVGVLGVMLIVSATVNLIQGKFAFALAVVIGGAVLLVASFRLLNAAGGQLKTFSDDCAKQTQIEFVQPVAKIE